MPGTLHKLLEPRRTVSPALVVLSIASVVVLIVGWFGCREAERNIRAEWAELRAAGLLEPAAPLYTIRAIYAGWGTLLLIAFITSAWLHWRWFRAEGSREESRRQLESLARHFKMVLDSATQVSIVATDMSGTITLFNAGAERMLGYRAVDVVGKQTPALIHVDEEVREHGEALSRQFGRPIQGFGVFVEYARQGSFEEREWTYVRKDGSRLSVSLVVTALTDSSGQMTGFLGIARDVTERLAAEQALREAKEAAERASRAKSEFLATMSHEIRTPMNAVIGLTELVLDDELTPVQRDYLESAREAAEGLMTIINEVLDFSKIEATEITLECVPFSLRALVGEALKTLAPRAAFKRLDLAWRVARDTPDVVRGDPTRLRQVLMNLTGNAIKFTAHGEVTVEVESSSADEGRDSEIRLHLQVRDTGIGIPREKLAEIFQPFTQADMSTTRRFGGTGLGLSICAKLVRLLRGRIWVESREGQGSVFHVEVALQRAGIDEAPTEESSRPLTAPPDTTVLIVDSPTTHRKFLHELLAEWGFAVEACDDGLTAGRMLRDAQARGVPVAVVIAARHATDNDGAWIEALRREASAAQPDVLLLGTGVPREDARRAAELRTSGLLSKPIVHAELRRALGEILARRAGNAPPSPRVEPPGTGTSRGPRLRILVGEDVVMNQKLARGLLRRWGHEVEVASNGREVLRMLDERPFDLVLMDVSMPELDGLDATREIRRREAGTSRHVPIVAMTAHAFAADEANAYAAGMDGYVTKPIRRHELAAVLAELFPVDAPSAESPHAEATGAAAPSVTGGSVAASRGAANSDETSREPAHPAESLRPAMPSAQMASRAGVTLDWSLVLRELDEDRDLLRDVLAVCLDEAPRLTNRLSDATAAGDLAACRRAAHALRGALRLLAPTHVADRVDSLDAAARAGDLERLTSELAAWRHEWADIRDAIEGYLHDARE